MPDTFQSQNSKGGAGCSPLTLSGSGVLTPRRRALSGASAWAFMAVQRGPGVNVGYLAKAAAAVNLGGLPCIRRAGCTGAGSVLQGGRAVLPLVYVSINDRKPTLRESQPKKNPVGRAGLTGSKSRFVPVGICLIHEGKPLHV